MIDDKSLDELERLAKAATLHGWTTKQGEPGLVYVVDDNGEPYCTVANCRPGGADNAAFIAAANPQTVLALVEEVRRLCKDNYHLRAACSHPTTFDSMPPHCAICGIELDDHGRAREACR